MMNQLDQQLQALINEAPQYGVPSAVMETAVSPVLKLFALQLQHPNYYLLVSANQSLIVTTLSHRQQPQAEKRVIYGFSSEKEAQAFQGVANSSLNIVSFPVTHLLFELFALKEVDSLIFMDNSLEQGKEIQRDNLQKAIQQQIQQLKFSSDFYA